MGLLWFRDLEHKKNKLSDIQKTDNYEVTKKCSSYSGSGRSRCCGCGGSGIRGYCQFCMSCGGSGGQICSEIMEKVKSINRLIIFYAMS